MATDNVTVDIGPGRRGIGILALLQALLFFGELLMVVLFRVGRGQQLLSFLLPFEPFQGGLAPRLADKVSTGTGIVFGGFRTRQDPSNDQEFHVAQVFKGVILFDTSISISVVVVVGSSSNWSFFLGSILGRYLLVVVVGIGHDGLLFKPVREFVGIHASFGGMNDNGMNQGGTAIVATGLMDCGQVIGAQIGQNVDLEFRGKLGNVRNQRCIRAKGVQQNGDTTDRSSWDAAERRWKIQQGQRKSVIF
jgi:hypothetical protein